MKENSEEKQEVYIVFKAGNNTYAIESSCVKEILRNNEIYKIPFVPEYVTGILNYYGKPYVVVDFSMFLDRNATQESLFMVLNNDNGIAIRIQDIQDFYPAESLHQEKVSDDSDQKYFSKAVIADLMMCPVLNIENITEKIRSDIDKN